MSSAIGKRVYEALSKQMNDEFASSYLFLAISSVFEDMGLNGCANWAILKAKEKMERAMKFYNHILDRRAKIKLLPIPAPKQDWRAPLHIFEEIVRLEQKITGTLYSTYEYIISEKDYCSKNLIMHFINEQITNENVAITLLDRIRKMQTTEIGVLTFDSEISKYSCQKKETTLRTLCQFH